MSEGVTKFSLMLRVCVGRGDQMLALIILVLLGTGQALIITECVYEWERETKILQLILCEYL